MDDAVEESKASVWLLLTSLEFEILVPEGFGARITADGRSGPLEEPVDRG